MQPQAASARQPLPASPLTHVFEPRLGQSAKVMNASNPDPGTLMLEGESVAQKYIDELTAQGVNKVVLVRGAG